MNYTYISFITIKLQVSLFGRLYFFQIKNLLKYRRRLIIIFEKHLFETLRYRSKLFYHKIKNSVLVFSESLQTVTDDNKSVSYNR